MVEWRVLLKRVEPNGVGAFKSVDPYNPRNFFQEKLFPKKSYVA